MKAFYIECRNGNALWSGGSVEDGRTAKKWLEDGCEAGSVLSDMALFVEFIPQLLYGFAVACYGMAPVAVACFEMIPVRQTL